MSSSHYIIVARNTKTGAIELPLGDMTLYGSGVDPETGEYEEEKLVRECAKRYGPEWAIALYGMLGANYSGSLEK
ncbi:hypothetical protein GOD90_10370 [Sinorhizobium medicae]|nr:hypothetical protein [Sinorhizobium medicae]